MNCEGPCLSHCYRCPGGTMVLSQMAFIYIIACVVYMLVSPKFGTPFMDSLTEEQKELKNKSKKKRTKLFITGIVVGIIVVKCWRPYTKFPLD